MHPHQAFAKTLLGSGSHYRSSVRLLVIGALAAAFTSSSVSGQWVDFADETATRLSASPSVGSGNPDEKDYAWGDLDKDGAIDLVAVYKELGTSTGRRANALFMNEGGVLVDRTAIFARLSTVTLQGGATSQGFLDPTNDRDVAVVDVNGDTWLDIVTATTLSGGPGGTVGDKAISHPRIYINRGEDVGGAWLGFIYDDVDRVPTMPAEPRFCSVSSGDLDGDGDQDLYFGDYQQGGNRPADLNDRLWINNGTGRFADESTTRMTLEMLESSFAMSTAVADMNGDGRLDVVKDDALNAPQGVSISYNNRNGVPSNDGFFDAYEIAYANTPYHIAVGDLNNDTLLDLVVTDDAQDFYSLNTGNGQDGLANFAPRQLLIGSVSEFGGNNLIVDLDKDNWNDVIVTSVDVDLTSCSTFSRVFRNLLNDPNPRIEQQGNVGIDPVHLQGGHDVAAFDIDGDTWIDLVIGTCSGTTVYINQAAGTCLVDGDCNFDGLFCTSDVCVGGFCQFGPAPCPGQVCDEANDTCVNCLIDADCDADGLFCTNDVCSGGNCQLGPDPCPGQLCDEAGDTCANCLVDGDCDLDGLFCTNDICVGGNCQAGPDPCPGLICDDGNDTCVNCLTDNDCNADGLFCTLDQCIGGACQLGGDPCPGQTCDETNDVCVSCFTDSDCDADGLSCTPDLCVGGACQLGPDPCPGQVCDEVLGCVDCVNDADCGGGFCCGNRCQPGACVIALQPKAGDPLAGLTQQELERFFAGKAEFNRTWTAEQGLGPVFNRESCGSCHNNPIGGSGGLTVTRFGLLNGGPGGTFDDLAALGGSLLQAQAIDPGCAETIPVIPGETVHTATRATPSALGFGLLEAIEDADIEAAALNPPSPSVSGRIHMVQPLEGGPLRVGRFGWKAQVATVMTFSGDALLNEVGITNDLVPAENAPNGDPALLAACDSVPDPEDVPDAGGIRFIDRVTDFQRFLAAPPQTPKSGMSGEVIFASIGCTDCHTPVFATSNDPGLEPSIRSKVVKPYSDFLLHDVGPLGDGIVQGDAQGGEIRTPPLWGLRRRDPMLHDASIVAGTFAARVTQAIVSHGLPGSEANASVNLFTALPPADKDAVIAFLDSLGRCEFDLTGDDDVNHDDYFDFLACVTGPGSFYTPDDPCSIADIDQDGDVDDDDFFFFRIATENCCDLNGNGIRDSACTWCDPAGACTYVDLAPTFADMGGSFGVCSPDGFSNVHDRNHALTCFSGTSPCEDINVDAGGPFGDCNPDGFCNIHDANHALAAFAGTNACTCPPSPSPQSGAQVVASAGITLNASQRAARAGDTVQVRVFIDGSLPDLRSYQIETAVSGGRRGAIDLVEVSIETRDDHVFAGRPDDRFDAFNASNGRMLSGLTGDSGVETLKTAYLTTFTYRVSADAIGTFVVDVLHDEAEGDQTFLIAPGDAKIAVGSTTPAVIVVAAPESAGLR